MPRVTAPARTPSVAAMDASADNRKLDPSMAPAIRLAPGFRNAAAPQAQAAAASIAPRIEGMR